MTIISIGAALQDVFLRDRDDFSTIELNEKSLFDRIELGTKIDIDNVTFSTGGGATNAAVTFARQGLESVFIGVVGSDLAGMAVLESLRSEGVKVGHVRYSKELGTGYSVMLLSPSGERTSLIYRGASISYKSIDLKILSAIKPDWVYISTLSGDFEFISALWAECMRVGAKIMFNPGLRELKHYAKLKPLLANVNVLLVNKQEAQMLVQSDELENLTRGLKIWSEAECVIVSDGSNGAVATYGEELIRAGLHDRKKPKDKTGAGDAFGSGFLCSWATGKSLKESLDFGSANASSVVSQIGAKTGILRKKEIK